MKKASLSASRDAAARLEAAEYARRRAEADKIEALCDLAAAYDLDDEELFLEVLVDQRIQLGGVGTPLVSEMISLEIAGLLKIPVAHAASELSAALDLKYRHPRLFEAVLNVEIEVDRAQMMTTRCRDLHPMLLDEITAVWLARQEKPDGSPCTGLLSCSHEPTEEARALVPGEDSVRVPGELSALCQGGGCACPDAPRTRRFDPHECAGHHCGTITTPVAKLRPSLGIAVHIHADAVGQLDPAARVEKAGTITTTLLAELLGEGDGYNLKIQPVIDLANLAPADGYVPSSRMRCGMVLAFPNEPFPFSQRDSGGLDLDHTIPYERGRSGQTRVGNLAPLTRRVHRAKTAGYWVMHQPEPGRIEWRSPLGYRYDVTPFGTERCQPIHYNPDDTRAPLAG